MTTTEYNEELRLELMTFEDVAAALKRGFDAVVVPCAQWSSMGHTCRYAWTLIMQKLWPPWSRGVLAERLLRRQ